MQESFSTEGIEFKMDRQEDTDKEIISKMDGTDLDDIAYLAFEDFVSCKRITSDMVKEKYKLNDDESKQIAHKVWMLRYFEGRQLAKEYIA